MWTAFAELVSPLLTVGVLSHVAWVVVGFALCVLGDAVEEPAPPNNRPVYLIPNDREEER